MIKMMTIFGLLITSSTAFSQASASIEACNGKTIYFQTYDGNSAEMSGILKELRPVLVASGARVPPLQNQSDFERRTGKRPSYPKHQVDYNIDSESDKICAQFLQNEIGKHTKYSIIPVPSEMVKLAPSSTHVANHIVFSWSGRTKNAYYTE